MAEVQQGNAGSSPGITGIRYGHLRAFLLHLQRLFHSVVRVVVTQGVVPDGLVDLIVVALPKGSAQVGSVQGCRPISLYEVNLKIATGIVHCKMQQIVARHHLLNNRQIFNVRNRGVHDVLQLVLGALSRTVSQGKPVYVASTDVIGAFPSVPL